MEDSEGYTTSEDAERLTELSNTNERQLATIELQQATLERLRDNMYKLLKNIGDVGKCRGCKQHIIWVKHKNGKATPYTQDGLNHFIDCPNAKAFKR